MSEIETLSLLFDSAWYLATYQDVAAANCDPLEHYLAFGYKEGRNPNRFFSTNFYLATYPDITACHLNPFIHYILYGASEGRLPRSPHQSPLPPITFEIFFQDEDNITVEPIEEKHIVSPSPKLVDNETKKITKNTKQKETVLPLKESVQTKIEPEAKSKRRTVKTPALQTKPMVLSQRRKKTIKI